MPTYEYECTKCGKVFEVFQPITERPKRSIKTDCKQCNNRAPVTRRIGAGAGVIFKGSGFYQTDYRSEAYKKAAQQEKKSSEGKKGKEGDGKAAKDKGGKSSTTEKAPDKKESAAGPTTDS